MTKRITTQMSPDQLRDYLSGNRGSVARAREAVKSTKDTDLQAIAYKLAVNAIMSESAIVIELPLPPAALSPNWRGHWGQKSRAVNQYRTLAKFAALPQRPKKPFAALNYFFVFKVPRKQDRDNLIASMKAGLDSLQDAGFVENDSCLHPMGVELFSGKAHEPFGVRIILWERV